MRLSTTPVFKHETGGVKVVDGIYDAVVDDGGGLGAARASRPVVEPGERPGRAGSALAAQAAAEADTRRSGLGPRLL